MNRARHLEQALSTHFDHQRLAIVLLGARQIGKTTLLRRLFPEAQYFLLDNDAEKRLFERYDISYYRSAIANLGEKTLILDEIQNLSNPGRALKILYDQVPSIRIVATGSSSLYIKNKLAESMAGRKITYQLGALTFSETLVQKNLQDTLDHNILENIRAVPAAPKAYLFDIQGLLCEALLYGSYPHLLNSPRDTRYLSNIAHDAIYKDILELSLIENRSDAKKLLQLLAYQIGNLINYAQIASRLSMDVRTVKRYIEIFEQSFLLFRLYPFSNNKKTELSKSPKIYFHDLGIRNALINNFDDFSVRSDRGAMFENFIISEVMKLSQYSSSPYAINYWRTKSGSEVDLVLSRGEEIIGCEIKTSKGSVSQAFANHYPKSKQVVITMENFY